MNLIWMSLAGAAMILVTIGLRALFLNKLPKKMFLVLWWAALIRLLVPVSLHSGFSVYSLLPQPVFLSDAKDWEEQEETGQAKMISVEEEIGGTAENLQQGTALDSVRNMEYAKNMQEKANSENGNIAWKMVWATGMFLSALFFLSAYFRGCREFRCSFPVEEEKIRSWEEGHKGIRRIRVRWSERVRTPLSYGIMNPVILMPKGTDWSDDKQVAYVLEHEYVHIKRFDIATKLILTAGVCIHWFNPLVWIMYLFFNRDIEISCDEEVVRHFGEEARSGYARILIGMEEKKSGLLSFGNGFGKIAIEERIKAIMKMKKTSAFALAAAVFLVAVVVLGFGTVAKEKTGEQREYLKSAFGSSYTEKECDMLADLWIDDYADMTVSEYQDKIWKMTDTQEYINLLDTFSNTIWEFGTDGREGEALNQYFQYYDYVFSPLCSDRWEKREFSGAAIWREGQVYTLGVPEQGNTSADTAILEYEISLHIEDPHQLTVAEYRDARLVAEKGMEEILRNKSEAELTDAKLMGQYLEKETKRIASERSNENLTAGISYSFLPLEYAGPDQDQDRVKREIQARIDTQIEAINMLNDQLKMVEHQMAAEKNKADELSALVQDMEKRRYPPASQEDYESLLALMKPDYRSMSIADFNAALLDWCNEDYGRMERISEDAMQGEYGKALTPEEKSFVDLTYGLSGEENHRMVNNMRADEPEKQENLRYGWISHSFYKSSDDGLAWVDYWYCFYWYITDRDKLTVGDRDAGIKGYMEEVEAILSGTDLDELLDWETEDFMQLLRETGEKYSNDLLKIEAADVSIEHMDERGLAAERER